MADPLAEEGDTPDPQLAVAAAAASALEKPFGYSDNFTKDYPSPDYYQDRLFAASSGGASHVRISMTGCPGVLDPAPVDGWDKHRIAMEHAAELGMSVVLSLGWSPDCVRVSPPTDSQLGTWQQFVALATSNSVYWSGYRTVHVEIWNEPNMRAFWCGSQPKKDEGEGSEPCQPTPDPGRYAVIYYYAWQGAQDADAWWGGVDLGPVMTGGGGVPRKSCNPPDAHPWIPYYYDPYGYFAQYHYICVRDFLQGVKFWLGGWGAVGRVERTGAHIYPKPNGDISRADSRQEAIDQFDTVRSVFSNSNRPTFVTETGVRSNQPLSPGQQCKRLLDIYDNLLGDPDAAGLLVYRVLDTPDPDESNEHFYEMGTLTQTGIPKPSWWWLLARRRGVSDSC